MNVQIIRSDVGTSSGAIKPAAGHVRRVIFGSLPAKIAGAIVGGTASARPIGLRMKEGRSRLGGQDREPLIMIGRRMTLPETRPFKRHKTTERGDAGAAGGQGSRGKDEENTAADVGYQANYSKDWVDDEYENLVQQQRQDAEFGKCCAGGPEKYAPLLRAAHTHHARTIRARIAERPCVASGGLQ
ncbi:hypothetical protein [Nocardioides sp.]|uniref:hypothetical protein n=1 Tax=Nocardioides sp. TaxID=35761 RepID=UPI001998DA7E|nr:hypothetical protein [Nocardioides sp.]MBC7275625.1 hypothetical protein [Nocardioides sp.]